MVSLVCRFTSLLASEDCNQTVSSDNVIRYSLLMSKLMNLFYPLNYLI